MTDYISPPPQNYINASCQELLMLEMTNMAHRQTRTTIAARDLPSHTRSDEDELSEREILESKLENIGYRVGHGLVERFSSTARPGAGDNHYNHNNNNAATTAARPMLIDHLDIIKFICKDLWILLFNKQIDNLKTNHKGIYVLADHQFKWFTKMSYHPTLKPNQEALNKGKGHAGVGKEYTPYLWFPCGIVRGALANLGMESVVIAECPNGLPGVTFQIKTISSKP